MALDRLVERIMDDARKRVDLIAEEGYEDKERILEEARRQAEEHYGASLNEMKAGAEQQKERAITSASLTARIALLEERRMLMKEVFDKAIEMMRDQPREQYLEMLTGMIVDAKQQLAGEEALVILSGDDRDDFGEELLQRASRRLASSDTGGRLRLSDESRDLEAGFVLKAGRIEIDNSFDALVESRREELEKMVAKMLFGGVSL